nr:hypothetical protein JVH1_4397 [Rhodococcus sp. JVH1]
MRRAPSAVEAAHVRGALGNSRSGMHRLRKASAPGPAGESAGAA